MGKIVQVIKGFEPKDRCSLLKFVTSCSRAPLLGFKYLQPAFTIHKVCNSILSFWQHFFNSYFRGLLCTFLNPITNGPFDQSINWEGQLNIAV